MGQDRAAIAPSLAVSDSILDSGLDDLLSCLLLTRSDFTFRDDYTDRDSFRLTIVDSLMAHPLEMIPFTELSLTTLAHFDSLPNDLLAFYGRCVGRRIAPSSDEPLSSGHRLPLKRLREPLAGPLRSLVDRLDAYQTHIISIYQKIMSGETGQFIRINYKELMLMDVADVNRSVEELDSLQKADEADARWFAKMAVDVPAAPPLDMESLFRALDSLRAIAATDPQWRKRTEPDRPLLEQETPYGQIVIGGFGNDTYRGDYFIIIDPGGDDAYYLSYDIAHPHPTLIADFGGDDYYEAVTDFTLACGAISCSILIDDDGDDIYRGTNFSVGAAYFGLGLLWDKKGNDHYFGDTFTQGAGTFGLGLLVDSDGSDTYTGNLHCQGFGFVRGLGGIIDYRGNDTYTVQPKYQDILRYDDHYISLSQGFAYGIRPILSGGFGFIGDFAGNDIYVSDIFGQGSSYWWSLGMLYDRAGNDQYISYQYAQGAGAHMTLGVLCDDAGNDVYRAHGVSQGCGHDYSCGWLLDRAGDDVYSSYDLSQGAGSANGFGILTDLSGTDGYYVFRKANSQGYGNPRRDYGSIGLFLDIGGDDRYDGNGSNNHFWRTVSKWGGGLDNPGPTAHGAGVK